MVEKVIEKNYKMEKNIKDWRLFGGCSVNTNNNGYKQCNGCKCCKCCDGMDHNYNDQERDCRPRNSKVTPGLVDLLENVLDVAFTLVKIMCTCGIDEDKSNRALDVIAYHFINFIEESYPPGCGGTKKRLRKEELCRDLKRLCCFGRNDTNLAFSIIKNGFKAFYRRQSTSSKFDLSLMNEDDWEEAARRTICAFANTGANRSEIEKIGKKIRCVYRNYINRIHERQNYPSDDYDIQKCSQKDEKMDNASPEYDLHIEHLKSKITCETCNDSKGSKKIMCRDSKGRIFLAVDGPEVFFDPCVMSEKARKEITKEENRFCKCCDNIIPEPVENIKTNVALADGESRRSVPGNIVSSKRSNVPTVVTVLSASKETRISDDNENKEYSISGSLKSGTQKSFSSDEVFIPTSPLNVQEPAEIIENVENESHETVEDVNESIKPESIKGEQDDQQQAEELTGSVADENGAPSDSQAERSQAGAIGMNLKCQFSLSVYESSSLKENILHMDFIGCNFVSDNQIENIKKFQIITPDLKKYEFACDRQDQDAIKNSETDWSYTSNADKRNIIKFE